MSSPELSSHFKLSQREGYSPRVESAPRASAFSAGLRRKIKHHRRAAKGAENPLRIEINVEPNRNVFLRSSNDEARLSEISSVVVLLQQMQVRDRDAGQHRTNDPQEALVGSTEVEIL